MDKETVFNMLPEEEILTQLAEECSEAAQAALKLRRAKTGVNPTPVSESEALLNLVEELADIYLCAFVMFGGELDVEDYDNEMDALMDAIGEIIEKKLNRWKRRLVAKEAEKHG